MKKDSAIVRFFVLIFLGVFAIAIIIAFPLFLTNELDNQNQDFLKEISAKNGESVGFKFPEYHQCFLLRLLDCQALLCQQLPQNSKDKRPAPEI